MTLTRDRCYPLPHMHVRRCFESGYAAGVASLTDERDALAGRLAAMEASIAMLVHRYENTSRDTRSRPDVIADNLRAVLDAGKDGGQ